MSSRNETRDRPRSVSARVSKDSVARASGASPGPVPRSVKSSRGGGEMAPAGKPVVDGKKSAASKSQSSAKERAPAQRGARVKPPERKGAKAPGVPKAAKPAEPGTVPRSGASLATAGTVDRGRTAKTGMTGGGKAGVALRAANARDGTVGSQISTIAVSSRSGGDKVKAIDTMKVAVKSGEAGVSATLLPNGYRPSESEPFMNERQRVYFRNKLVSWKEEIVRQNRETLQGLHEDSAQHADVADRATFETDRALELRARDRQRKLVSKIDAALARIEDGSYGYCEETGEPIGLKRLDARPIATLSIEAQERHERRERVFRDE